MHRNQLVEYYPKEETLPPMIEDYVPMDRLHGDFYERFMEQRNRKLGNSEQTGSSGYASQKRVSNTSSDSGVNSPHVLSPAMPITPDSSQFYLMPSTSPMNPPSGPITPIQQFINKSRKCKKRNLKIFDPSPINLTHSLRFVLTPDKATNSENSSFICFSFFYSYKFLLSGTHQLFIQRSYHFVLLQITMPRCHKIYPNCIWHVPSVGFGLKFHSALLTKVYGNYATHIVRVCFSPLYPINPQLHCSKTNLRAKFGSRAMASLYEPLCHLSLTNKNPLLEELLSYLPTRFPSHIFDYIAYECSDNESVTSTDSSVPAFFSDNSTYFS